MRALRTTPWLSAAGLALLFTLPLAACAPKTCEPKPLPAGYEEAAELLPTAAVVCERDDVTRNSVFMQFSSRDVKKLTYEAILKLRAAGWAVDSSSRAEDTAGYIDAHKQGRMLHMGINHQNGGPYVGRITGSLTIVGTARVAR